MTLKHQEPKFSHQNPSHLGHRSCDSGSIPKRSKEMIPFPVPLEDEMQAKETIKPEGPRDGDWNFENETLKTETRTYLANGQPFKLLGITYFCRENKGSNFYFRVHWLSKCTFSSSWAPQLKTPWFGGQKQRQSLCVFGRSSGKVPWPIQILWNYGYFSWDTNRHKKWTLKRSFFLGIFVSDMMCGFYDLKLSIDRSFLRFLCWFLLTGAPGPPLKDRGAQWSLIGVGLALATWELP